MAKGSARLVIILGVVVVVGVAAALLIKSAVSSKKTGVDKKEATTWSQNWKRARACLVGPRPYASAGPLGMEVREAFVPDISDIYKGCTVLLEITRRPPGHSSDDKRAEKLWIDVGLALRNLEEAVRVRIDGHSRKKVDDIGRALLKVDEQYARLAAAAGLEAPDIKKRAESLRKLSSKPLRWKGGWVRTQRPLRQLGKTYLGVHRESDKNRERLFVVSGPNQVEMRERAIDVKSLRGVRVVPIAELNKTQVDKAPTIRKLDDQEAPAPAPAEPNDAGVAEPAEPSHALVYDLDDKPRVIVKALPTPIPLFHLADKDTHIVGFKVDTELFIVESTDKGKTWKRRFNSGKAHWQLQPLGWSRLIVKLSEAERRSYVNVDIEAAERTWEPRVIASGKDFRPAFSACFAGDSTAWWLLHTRTGELVVRDVNGRMTVVGQKQALRVISSCSPARAIALGIRAKRQAAVVVCDANGCTRAFDVPGFADGGAVATPDGKVVAASKDRQIVGVWRAGQRQFYRLPTKGRLHQLAVFGDKVYGILGYGYKRRLLEIPTAP